MVVVVGLLGATTVKILVVMIALLGLAVLVGLCVACGELLLWVTSRRRMTATRFMLDLLRGGPRFAWAARPLSRPAAVSALAPTAVEEDEVDWEAPIRRLNEKLEAMATPGEWDALIEATTGLPNDNDEWLSHLLLRARAFEGLGKPDAALAVYEECLRYPRRGRGPAP